MTKKNNLNFIFFILFFKIFISNIFAQVELSGIQREDLNFKASKNPYIITGDVLIKRRVLWNINPGVIIQIRPKYSKDQFIDTTFIRNDKQLPVIHVMGSFQCIGGEDKRIIIGDTAKGKTKINWYGIFFDNANDEYTKIKYTDIKGALYGIRIKEASPVIRNCLIAYNQNGIYCDDICKSSIYNNNIIYNHNTAIINKNATPYIFSNIIAYNLVGIWSDRVSALKIEYNDFWKNEDSDFIDCPPRYGIISALNENKDSCDYKYNIFKNPVFYGSKAHSDSLDYDFKVASDSAKKDVEDQKLSRIIVKSIPDSVKKSRILNAEHKPWQLSKYSRLIDAGHPDSDYKDMDGTVNDIGLSGGSEFKF